MVTEYTDISCCNVALDHIGAETIDDLSDTTDTAATCSRLYPVVRDTLLSSYDWKFARAKRQLVISGTETPRNEWKRAFMLPPDMLVGPTAVFGDGASRPTFAYEVYGSYLYCDYETVIIDCKVVRPVSEWPPYFYDLCSLCLAARLCIPLTDNTERASELRIEAYGPAQMDGNGGAFARAKRVDAQNMPVKSLFQNGDPLTVTRY